MSGFWESVQWNACVHRLDRGLYCHPKSLWGMESEPMLSPRKKSPLPEAQRKFEPATLHLTGQQAQHTTDCPVPALISFKLHMIKLTQIYSLTQVEMTLVFIQEAQDYQKAGTYVFIHSSSSPLIQIWFGISPWPFA